MASSQNSPGTVCLSCGDKGATDLLIYCRKCPDSAIHHYCMDYVSPDDDDIYWVCWDCAPQDKEDEPSRQSQEDGKNKTTLALGDKANSQDDNVNTIDHIQVSSLETTWASKRSRLSGKRSTEELRAKIVELEEENAELQWFRDKYKYVKGNWKKINAQLVDHIKICGVKRGRPSKKKARRKAQHQLFAVIFQAEEGKKWLENWWDKKMADYLVSNEFKHILAKKAIKYYYHGFDTCLEQVKTLIPILNNNLGDSLNPRAGFDNLPNTDSEDDYIEVSDEEGDDPDEGAN